ncbi:hypothetical protein EYZ11_009581 [Aspergillus tanneri]|uniref:Nuclear pore assembly and biogenesis-domain-containing protein n=1 Tax=Aspergillus tanneri TaxID=1220188 RepID=A0A4S3J7Z5_9EURO|nr:hypothetical protein EYZ11_009581 [Aspergillus tanneri]
MDYLARLDTIQTNPTIQHLSHRITTHLMNLLTQLDPYVSALRTDYLEPYVIRPLATMLASSMPDLVSVLALAFVLLISLKILDYARRVIMFWVSLVLRLIWWGLVLGLGWYVYTFGWERTNRDLGWVCGVAKGFVEGLQNGFQGQGHSGKSQEGNLGGKERYSFRG